MAALTKVILDAWTALGYKAPLRDEAVAKQKGWQAQSWLPEKDRRRLAAYMVLAAYEANAARVFIGGDDDDRDSNREYGDAALIIDSVLSHLLGETQEIVVPGAEDYDPALLEPPADEPGDSDDDDQEDDDTDEDAPVDEIDPDVIAEQAAAKRLVDRQEFLREWAEDIHLTLRMTDGERKAVHYGDGVYLLGWDAKRERVTCAVMDPGFYFPVLPDTLDSYEYPETVHFAWELPPEDFTDNKTRLRRITYRLGPIVPLLVEDEETGELSFENPEDTTEGEDGKLFRKYPWDSEEPSNVTCYLTDATWILDDTDDADIDALTLARATIRETDDGEPIQDLDLGIDFLPVVHVPNTPPAGEHFGQSSLSRILQLLDDLQQVDTDSQKASAVAGSPIIGIKGKQVVGDPTDSTSRKRRTITVGPGEVWDLGEDGGLDVVDTSAALAELRNLTKDLIDRLSVNSRLPGVVLGTVKPSEAPSGYAMQLSFGPLSAMVRTMRLTRAVKHPLLLKMVQRLYQANDKLEAGPTPRAEYRLGSFLPSDLSGTLALVKDAVDAKLISIETAMNMLIDAGFPIEDVAEEIERIEHRDFQGANELADATGSAEAVAEYLGRDLPTEEPTPQVPLPIVGAGAPVPPVPGAQPSPSGTPPPAS